jgi:hypothetical protein
MNDEKKKVEEKKQEAKGAIKTEPHIVKKPTAELSVEDLGKVAGGSPGAGADLEALDREVVYGGGSEGKNINSSYTQPGSSARKR